MRALRILVSLALLGAVTLASPTGAAAATTFTVNRIGDQADLNLANAECDVSSNTGRQCTLRAAIQEANDTPGVDTINFNIASASKTITPATPLPPITDELTINGYSQSGASVNTRVNGNNAVLKIVLDGVNVGNADGLVLDADAVTVRGLVIQRFAGSGILLRGESGEVAGNFIGTTSAGTAARGNGTGIRLLGQGHLIGGANPGQRNLISGNVGVGLFVDQTTGGSSIHGNYIGTDRTGTAALGNGNAGVRVDGPNTRIGGTAAGAGNLISGNGDDGLLVFGTSGTIIQGNRIGTDRSGTAALGNNAVGVNLHDAQNTLVGGTTAAARNVISGNGETGVSITDGSDNTLQGNFIGTKADGSGDLGNGDYGVLVSGSLKALIGGSDPGARNTIRGNGFDGIETTNGASVSIRGNTIVANDRHGVGACATGFHDVLSNQIVSNAEDGVKICSLASSVFINNNLMHGNGGLGINIDTAPQNADDVNPNDNDDLDTGPNGRQNYPVLISAVRSNSTSVTTVTGTLNSTPNTSFRIELYIAAADASAHGEGLSRVGVKTITTGADGDKGFTFAISTSVGTVLTSTASQLSPGATSEFSANITVVPGP